MPLELLTIPCLSDNYAFVIHDAETGDTALIDAPEAAPIKAALEERGWTLTDILLTHHHDDHVAGVEELRGDARVVGAQADAHRMPALDDEVVEGDALTVLGRDVEIYDVSGHTVGHIAFHFPSDRLLFPGDSLMAQGCGRLFEGDAAQMWDSLKKLRDFHAETQVCSGHEYTLVNSRFAADLEPGNPALISRLEATEKARENGRATVPSLLGQERDTNPFLRADDPALAQALGMEGSDPAEIFREVRSRRDRV